MHSLALFLIAFSPNDLATNGAAWIAAALALAVGFLGALTVILPRIAALKTQVETLFDLHTANSDAITTLAINTPPPSAPQAYTAAVATPTGPTPGLMLLGILSVGLSLGACSVNSPFEGATTAKAGDGKIPVQMQVSADASGDSDSSKVAYDGGAKIVFGLGVTPAEESALVTRARTTGAQVTTAHDQSLGHVARIVFGQRFSADRRQAFLRRLGVGAPETDYPVMDGPFTW